MRSAAAARMFIGLGLRRGRRVAFRGLGLGGGDLAAAGGAEFDGEVTISAARGGDTGMASSGNLTISAGLELRHEPGVLSVVVP